MRYEESSELKEIFDNGEALIIKEVDNGFVREGDVLYIEDDSVFFFDWNLKRELELNLTNLKCSNFTYEDGRVLELN